MAICWPWPATGPAHEYLVASASVGRSGGPGGHRCPDPLVSPESEDAAAGEHRPPWMGIPCFAMSGRPGCGDRAATYGRGGSRRPPQCAGPDPLGIREIGPHGIVRSDGALIAVLEVRPLNLEVMVEDQIAAAVAGLAQFLDQSSVSDPNRASQPRL